MCVPQIFSVLERIVKYLSPPALILTVIYWIFWKRIIVKYNKVSNLFNRLNTNIEKLNEFFCFPSFLVREVIWESQDWENIFREFKNTKYPNYWRKYKVALNEIKIFCKENKQKIENKAWIIIDTIHPDFKYSRKRDRLSELLKPITKIFEDP